MVAKKIENILNFTPNVREKSNIWGTFPMKLNYENKVDINNLGTFDRTWYSF
ncbi:hypothetical protein ACVRXS_00870 [Streptococcus orisratti]|uniref:hypothetical protein n=1 Tax=Streptococcus TaxID=1301 RepID=UPI000376C670|nr:hypothetical protein [Streptococcus orisratti]MDY5636574.1 hypothetical protein [Streptococcus orisratti]